MKKSDDPCFQKEARSSKRILPYGGAQTIWKFCLSGELTGNAESWATPTCLVSTGVITRFPPGTTVVLCGMLGECGASGEQPLTVIKLSLPCTTLLPPLWPQVLS